MSEYLSFPLFGLLADVKTGKYKTIITSVHFSFLSWIIGGLAIIVKTYLPENDTFFLIAFGIGFILELIGICCFLSNIVQFSLDQVIGASPDELSAIIHCFTMCIPLSHVVLEIGQCMIKPVKIVQLEEMVSKTKMAVKEIKENLDHKDQQDQEMEVWSLLDKDKPRVL